MSLPQTSANVDLFTYMTESRTGYGLNPLGNTQKEPGSSSIPTSAYGNQSAGAALNASGDGVQQYKNWSSSIAAARSVLMQGNNSKLIGALKSGHSSLSSLEGLLSGAGSSWAGEQFSPGVTSFSVGGKAGGALGSVSVSGVGAATGTAAAKSVSGILPISAIDSLLYSLSGHGGLGNNFLSSVAGNAGPMGTLGVASMGNMLDPNALSAIKNISPDKSVQMALMAVAALESGSAPNPSAANAYAMAHIGDPATFAPVTTPMASMQGNGVTVQLNIENIILGPGATQQDARQLVRNMTSEIEKSDVMKKLGGR